LWLCNGDTDLSNTPVILFGSEGGYHVVAKNITQLLQLLTYDAEPMASWERVYYYKDEQDHQPSEEIDRFPKWVFDKYQLPALSNTDILIEQAQTKYQDEFNEWIKKYTKEEE
jgi:hypothetical protein